ncbi:MAG: hypothetical protein HGA80_06015 [Candidatus Omnitrophica bacterium]|nr:hypothetical protein [Candidatus Omnitrophota bacterium]
MKKQDALFSVTLLLSAGLLFAVLADNIQDDLVARRSVAVPAQGDSGPERSAELRKKLEAAGLTLHAGQYWKEAN